MLITLPSVGVNIFSTFSVQSASSSWPVQESLFHFCLTPLFDFLLSPSDQFLEQFISHSASPHGDPSFICHLFFSMWRLFHFYLPFFLPCSPLLNFQFTPSYQFPLSEVWDEKIGCFFTHQSLRNVFCWLALVTQHILLSFHHSIFTGKIAPPPNLHPHCRMRP